MAYHDKACNFIEKYIRIIFGLKCVRRQNCKFYDMLHKKIPDSGSQEK